MVEMTQGEVTAFNIVARQIASLRGQFKQAMEAQKAMIALLEVKHNATFDAETGQFEPKKEEVNAISV